jgi:hypothetical protein
MHKDNARYLLLFLFLLLTTPMVVLGQNTEELCRAFINRAFGDLGNNCANLATDEVCYGYGNFGEVTSTFYVDGTNSVVREDIFTEPSERMPLLNMDENTTLETLVTEDLTLDRDNDSEDESRWGLAMLEVPANLPQQADKNSAVYVVFGGARLENAVLPEDAVTLNEDALIVTANDNSSLFASPVGLNYPVPAEELGTVSGELEADAISPDGNWLRIFFTYERRFGERTTAWIQLEDLEEPEGLESLPVLGPESYTPMQSFYLGNSFTQPECEQVPAAGVLVQGPDEIETDFTINNMPVRVTSTAYFRQLSANRFQVFALTGFTVLFPDTADESVLPEGFTQVLCLAEAQNLGIDGQDNDSAIELDCPEEGPRALTELELAGLASFETLPENTLNYVINLPTIVCPSGIGTALCIIVPASPARIEAKCEEGILPEDVCAKFGF